MVLNDDNRAIDDISIVDAVALGKASCHSRTRTFSKKSRKSKDIVNNYKRDYALSAI
jgi:hypothetical protein